MPGSNGIDDISQLLNVSPSDALNQTISNVIRKDDYHDRHIDHKINRKRDHNRTHQYYKR
eukprot:UN11611